MSVLRITAAKEQLERAEKLLEHIPGAANKAASRALNRATTNARANMVRSVRDNYTAKAGDIRSTMTVKKSSVSRLETEIKSSGDPIRLIKFKVNPKTVNGRRRTPIRVGVKRGGQTAIKKGFIARMPNGSMGVFERLGRFKTASSGRYAGKRREVIEQKFGPSVPQMIGNEKVLDYVSDAATEMFNDRLLHEVNRILEGGR